MNSPHPALSLACLQLRSSAVRELLRQAQRPGLISLAGGMPSATLFDRAGIEAAVSEVLAHDADAAFQYGPTEGQPSLLQQIQHLMRARRADSTEHRTLITAGSQQGLDLVARALLNPGDCVAVESPSYLAALQVFTLQQARVVSLPSDAEGLCTDALDRLFSTARPKLIYLVSTFSNPTGASLSLTRRQALLRWAARHRVLILEDDPYGELHFRGTPQPSLLALALEMEKAQPGTAEQVIYASSFSKILMPGLRLGWLSLPTTLFDAVARIKQATDLQTGSFNQEMAAAYLASGRLNPQIELIRRHYGAQQLALADALHTHFGTRLEFTLPEGGMFIWGKLNCGSDTQLLLNEALERGVSFVPGANFFADHPARNTLRLSYATASPDQLQEGVRRLKQAYDALHRQN